VQWRYGTGRRGDWLHGLIGGIPAAEIATGFEWRGMRAKKNDARSCGRRALRRRRSAKSAFFFVLESGCLEVQTFCDLSEQLVGFTLLIEDFLQDFGDFIFLEQFR
jgi:hypothetical protein